MSIEKTLPSLCRFKVLLWLGLLMLCSISLPSRALEPKNVLVIYSAGRLLPANIEFDRAFRQRLAKLQPDVRIYDEFLDVSRFPEAHQPQVFAAYLREKYAAHPPAVIVTAADMALGFLLKNRQQVFPHAPVVYAGVSQLSLDTLGALPADVLGVPGEIDFSATIEQALRWHPDTRRLVLVTGASSWDQLWESKLRQLEPTLRDRVAVEFYSGLPIALLQQKLHGLSADSLVFSPGFFKDGGGRDMLPRETTRLIGDALSVPFYGPFPTHIGTGIVGGYMLGWDAQAQQAGTVVSQLLAGIAPMAVKLPEKLEPVMQVDWHQTQRWGIDESQFPPGTLVHFREPDLLQQYGLEVLSIVLVMLLQAALIGALLIERRRRRLAEHEIQVQAFELAHASRLATAGQLTGSIAHEINQPLGAILSNAEAAELLLQAGSPDLVELRQIMADIRRDDLRASQVIRRLRALLDKHEQERACLDVNDSLTDVAALLRAEAQRRKVTLEFQLASLPARLLGDRVQIQQVLINLIFNAMDAVAANREDQRSVTVSVSRLPDRIAIRVQDGGHGIEAEHLPQVFDSFFSRKQGGMGLGLSIVKTIVEAHGGTILVEKTSTAGTVFCVELPLAQLLEPGVV